MVDPSSFSTHCCFGHWQSPKGMTLEQILRGCCQWSNISVVPLVSSMLRIAYEFLISYEIYFWKAMITSMQLLMNFSTQTHCGGLFVCLLTITLIILQCTLKSTWDKHFRCHIVSASSRGIFLRSKMTTRRIFSVDMHAFYRLSCATYHQARKQRTCKTDSGCANENGTVTA